MIVGVDRDTGLDRAEGLKMCLERMREVARLNGRE